MRSCLGEVAGGAPADVEKDSMPDNAGDMGLEGENAGKAEEGGLRAWGGPGRAVIPSKISRLRNTKPGSYR